MLFVNAHLAAHASKMKAAELAMRQAFQRRGLAAICQERTQNLHRILVDSPLRKRKEQAQRVHRFMDLAAMFMKALALRLACRI